jgi:hypothetical protein
MAKKKIGTPVSYGSSAARGPAVPRRCGFCRSRLPPAVSNSMSPRPQTDSQSQYA